MVMHTDVCIMQLGEEGSRRAGGGRRLTSLPGDTDLHALGGGVTSVLGQQVGLVCSLEGAQAVGGGRGEGGVTASHIDLQDH